MHDAAALRVDGTREVDPPAVASQQAARRSSGDDRRVLNGIQWRLRTGSPWAAISEITEKHCGGSFLNESSQA